MDITAQLDRYARTVTITAGTDQEFQALFNVIMQLPELLEQYIDENREFPTKFVEVKKPTE